MHEFAFVLPARPPFRLDLTAWALRRRPNNRIDRWDGQVYRRCLPLGPDREPILVAIRQSGPAEEPELQVSVRGATAHPTLAPAVTQTLQRLLGLDVDLSDFYVLAACDPKLAPLAGRLAGLKPPRFPSVFETLANAIACQQVSLTVGILLLNRLTEAYGLACEAPPDWASEGDESCLHAFPLPESLANVPPEALRPLGFSRQKAGYLINLAGSLASGQLDLESLAELDDEAARARLMQLRGVGRWSAEYVLLRGLGRLHVFPGDDVGARNGLQRWLDLSQSLDYDGVRQAVARWQPYSGLIYLHLLLDSLDAHLPGEAQHPPKAPPGQTAF